MTSKKKFTIALAGNPNAGKTSLFNKLTGLRAHVGNYPGVTVEQKWGNITYKDYEIKIVDLPGAYSLNSYSLEEKVARDFLFEEKPDLVLNVVDASNLDRNLYLSLQFLELGIPIVIALNMMDIAEKNGLTIDHEKLGQLLGSCCVPIVATTGIGINNLLDAVIATKEENKGWQTLEINYGYDLTETLKAIKSKIENTNIISQTHSAHWLAVKYLENDAEIIEILQKNSLEDEKEFLALKEKTEQHLLSTIDNDIEGLITDTRYGFINGLTKQAVRKRKVSDFSISDKIDSLLLNRLLAPFFFLAIIFSLYKLTFTIGDPLVGLFEGAFDALGSFVSANMQPGLLQSLITDGMIAGVGGVLSFVPLIIFMFIGVSILEDTGYMARIAFILDKVFRTFGLHGNSVVALIVGGGISGGCAIPGVMATRTLRDPKERIATILVTPFMNCGAKLPVFAMLIAAFFSENKATTMFLITLTGWVLALIAAKLLRTSILKGEATPFVMELPPYRLPTLKGIFLHAWERTYGYIKKAGSIILAVSVIMWALMTFPSLPAEKEEIYNNKIAALETRIENSDSNAEIFSLKQETLKISGEKNSETIKASFAGRVGTFFEPISKTIGLDWRTNIALVGGFTAKEVILSSLSTAYSMAPPEEIYELANLKVTENELSNLEDFDEESLLIESLSEIIKIDPQWSPLTAIALIVFILVYAPCFPTIALIRKEIGTRWAVFALLGNTAFAYILALILYQGGKLLGY